MSTKDDGGTAFPARMPNGGHGKAGPSYTVYPGMSLRDYFAAKALPSILDNPAGFGSDPMKVAGAAYGFAEAMLKVRDETC